MLGEVEFIIAAEHATFFDPHVTYGMTAAFEPIHMSGIMPFGEIMRLSLLGNYERMSAAPRVRDRLVSEVVPGRAAARARPRGRRTRSRRSRSSRSRAPSAPSGAHASSVTAQAVRLGYAYVGHGHEPGLHRRGPEAVRVGQAHRVDARDSERRWVAASRSSAPRCRTAAASTTRRRSSCTTRPRRARSPTPGSTKDDIDGFALVRHGPARAGRGRRVPRPAARRGSTAPASAARTWEFMVEHATAAIAAGHAEVVVLVYGSTARADLKRAAPQRQPLVRAPRARCSSTRRSGTR